MRIHPTSDWHTDLSYNDWTPPPVDADVIVHLGDLRAPGTLAIPALRAAYPDQENLFYVMGNHDFYSDHRSPDTKTTWEEQRARAPEIAAKHGVTLLDDAVAIIDGVRFLGGTLWTDFMMRPPYMTHADAVRLAGRMNDYRLIKTGRGRSHDVLKARDTIESFKATRRFIEEELAKPFDGDTVICTHHAPSRQSLMTPAAFKDLDWCYASDLEQLMHTVYHDACVGMAPTHVPPALWLHGHIHSNRDYTIGCTRVVANPRGYPLFERANSPRENPHFDPALVIEVGYDCTPRMGGM